jgi:putative DNA methylase
MSAVQPFLLKSAPALIERVLPAQKISAEAQKERKAVHGQTLTALGSYWKGRKPLILVKACVLGALLPATDDAEKDLAIFEKLMAIDDDAFLRRELSVSPSEVARRAIEIGALEVARVRTYFAITGRPDDELNQLSAEDQSALIHEAIAARKLRWRRGTDAEDQARLQRAALSTLSYLEKLDMTKRPEECQAGALFGPVWEEVNAHLGTNAQSFAELVEQLGIMRFGHRPMAGDTFCGGGSIPFEAARLGCDVYASDLNPIACLLTWGALYLIGGNSETRERIARAQAASAEAVDREITELRIEHDEHGNRAKAYLWCLETRCPQTGWMVPMATTWVISKNYRTCARLVPDHQRKRFEIEIVTGASPEQLAAAVVGTVVNNELVYELDGETYRTRIETLRGDYRLPDGTTGNRLRRWEKSDVVPRPDDAFQERLYCIQWITRATLGSFRPRFFFAAPTEADLVREHTIETMVREHLARWHEEGLVPDIPIEAGDKTDEPIRTRGWTYWHHLYSPRHLLLGALLRKQLHRLHNPIEAMGVCLGLCRALNYMSKMTQWRIGHEGRPGSAPAADAVNHVFYNQALNVFYNYGSRSFLMIDEALHPVTPSFPTTAQVVVCTSPANLSTTHADIFVTDPPYADAINYHEITEYFIAWLRKHPPIPQWIWDSRRLLAIRGSDEDFRRGMVEAYRAMARYMPDNGLQVVMFTHQDAGVWADMAAIVWGAGLQVTAAWYIATETTSDLPFA